MAQSAKINNVHQKPHNVLYRGRTYIATRVGRDELGTVYRIDLKERSIFVRGHDSSVVKPPDTLIWDNTPAGIEAHAAYMGELSDWAEDAYSDVEEHLQAMHETMLRVRTAFQVLVDDDTLDSGARERYAVCAEHATLSYMIQSLE
mgnify:CR=1 FL=1